MGLENIWCTHMNYVDAEVAKVHNMCHRELLNRSVMYS